MSVRNATTVVPSATIAPSQTAPISEFRTWLQQFSKEELSDTDAAKLYAEKLVKEADTTAIVTLLSQHLYTIAAISIRTKTKAAEKRASFVTRPKADARDVFYKKAGIAAPTNVVPSKLTARQKHEDAKARTANMRTTYLIRIQDYAHDALVELSDSFLDSKIVVDGKAHKWGDAKLEIVQKRYASLVDSSFGDFENLVFVRAILDIMTTEEDRGKTLRQIAKRK